MVFWLFLLVYFELHKLLLSCGLSLLSWEAVWTYSLFFHLQIQGKYSNTFYFLLSNVVSSAFWNQQLSFYFHCCSPSWFLVLDFVLQHFFLFLPYGAGWRPVGRSGNGNNPIRKTLFWFFPPLITASTISYLLFLEHLLPCCEHKTT